MKTSATKRRRDRRWREKNRGHNAELNRRWRSFNKDRKDAIARRYRQRHPAAVREAQWRKREIFVTVAEVEAARRRQKDRCAVCKETFKKTPHVDHDHVTKKFRALLCSNCNCGLGFFKDSLPRVLAAARYLAKHSSKGVR